MQKAIFMVYTMVSWYAQCLNVFSNREKKKPGLTIIRELFQCIMKYKCIPDHYFNYKLYLSSHPSNTVLDYVPDYTIAMKWFPIVNNHPMQNQILLNNKILFKLFMMHAGFPVPAPVLYIMNKTFFSADFQIISSDESVKRLNEYKCDRLFCKLDTGDGASDITCLNRINGKGEFLTPQGEIVDAKFLESLSLKGGYLLEEGLIQHPDLASIHPESINTIRYVTQFIQGNGAKPLYAILRMGLGKSVIDNVCKGGIFSVINLENGELDETAYNGECDIFLSHPDTNVVFKGLTIPNFNEINKMVLNAANIFPNLPSIGWDIALTKSGPVIIEGNDRWGSGLYQIAIGGIRKMLEEEWFLNAQKIK